MLKSYAYSFPDVPRMNKDDKVREKVLIQSSHVTHTQMETLEEVCQKNRRILLINIQPSAVS